MNKYLSLVYLYNRASCKKLILIAVALAVSLLAYMFILRSLDGIVPVVVFISALVLGMMAVVTSFNGKKAVKGDCSTTGYTIRRLCHSPLRSYLTMFVYYLMVIAIFWFAAIASIYIIGRLDVTGTGATDPDTRLALEFLQTGIGHALIPTSHPLVITFDVVVVLAFAGECARGCYLSWHNGTPSAGVAMIIVPAIIVWSFYPKNSYMIFALLVVFLYAALSFADVIFREKRPKGDPFKVNKHDGIVDMDSTEYDDDVFFQVNTSEDIYDTSGQDLIIERYEKGAERIKKKGIRRFDPFRLRRRYMPLGINMEKVNAFFGACLFIGATGHFVFYGKYMLQIKEIEAATKGMTIDPSVVMPYFWELQEHSFYGYMLAVLLALFLQAYWNHLYYNKTTKSVYVMKRLPDTREYGRTIWIGPAVQAMMIVAVMIVQVLVDLCLYIFMTPDIALPVDYLSHIIPF